MMALLYVPLIFFTAALMKVFVRVRLVKHGLVGDHHMPDQ